jgi:hypothetical protein
VLFAQQFELINLFQLSCSERNLFAGDAQAEIYLVESLIYCTDTACDPGARLIPYLSKLLIMNRVKSTEKWHEYLVTFHKALYSVSTRLASFEQKKRINTCLEGMKRYPRRTHKTNWRPHTVRVPIVG